MRIVISGAGVAGSVLAAALAGRPGVELTVIERAARNAHMDAGTALNIGPNGMQALACLAPAMAASLRADSFEWARWQVGLTDGTPLLDFGLSAVAECTGIRIRWSSLYDRLRTPIAHLICHDSTITSAAYGSGETAGRLSLEVSGPKGIERLDQVDLLVAAEGRYSPLREALCGPVPVEHFGIAISRLLVPDTSDGLIDDYAQWFNGPHRLLAYRVPPDHVYIVSTFPLAPGEPITEAMKSADAIDARYLPSTGSLTPACAWLLDAMRKYNDTVHWARMQQAPVCYRDPGGRLLVIGDAAHPLVPTLGQGATQALEDAVVAADVLCTGIDRALAGATLPPDLPALAGRVAARREARARFAADLSWRASDTLLAGCDPVRDTLRKGEPAFMGELARLFSGGANALGGAKPFLVAEDLKMQRR